LSKNARKPQATGEDFFGLTLYNQREHKNLIQSCKKTSNI